MRNCILKIVTVADGIENVFSPRNAEAELTFSGARISYREKEAQTELIAENGEVRIVRRGDYTLDLLLREGGRTECLLGIGGAEGKTEVDARSVKYTVKKDAFFLSAKYRLLFEGGEGQDMSVKLIARIVPAETLRE